MVNGVRGFDHVYGSSVEIGRYRESESSVRCKIGGRNFTLYSVLIVRCCSRFMVEKIYIYIYYLYVSFAAQNAFDD